MIHNPFLPQDSLCRAIYDPLSDLNYALVSSDPPLKSNAGMKGRNARESTRAMNLANRRRPRGSSTTIVHNFHRKGKGIGRDLIFPLTNRILERERFEGLENSRGISLPPSSATFRTCSIPFERGRRRRKGERGRKSGCIDPDAEIPDLHRAIISAGRETWERSGLFSRSNA